MKFKYANFIVTTVLCFVLIFNMVFLAIDGLSYSMENLPEGKLVYSVISANKRQKLNMYVAELNGVGTAVRGEVQLKDGSIKNVYWCIDETRTNASWVNEKMVEINGHKIHLDGELFDSRKRIELPEASYKNLVGEK